MTLCHNIGYTKMRLPNLLEHDSMQEASQQAASWVPLLNVKCHADSQLFLCSLFAPVCLERPIYPCRSLCQEPNFMKLRFGRKLFG
jgi:secreted frizzled-related protein 5